MEKGINVIYSSTNETTIQEVIQELIKVHTTGTAKSSKKKSEYAEKSCH